jgi:hypothetical protein
MTTSYNVILKAVNRVYLITFTVTFIILLTCTIGVGYLLFCDVCSGGTLAEKIVFGGLLLCMGANVAIYCYGRRTVGHAVTEPLLPL